MKSHSDGLNLVDWKLIFFIHHASMTWIREGIEVTAEQCNYITGFVLSHAESYSRVILFWRQKMWWKYNKINPVLLLNLHSFVFLFCIYNCEKI